MTKLKKLFSLAVILLLAYSLPAQQVTPVEQIRRYVSSKARGKDDSVYQNFFKAFKPGEVNYLRPLYEAIGWEDRVKKIYGDKSFNDIFSQQLAAVGDYKTAEIYTNRNLDTLSADGHTFIQQQVKQIKDLQSISAATYIAGRALDAKVVMINEAHDKPLHRAFTYSLLEPLYQQGYRYLAMEMLNNHGNASLTKLDHTTGYYAQEPVAGELIRKALSLGYTLVPYEDTAGARHTASVRDSIQAANIYKIIQQDPAARILVHAGYGHVSEAALGAAVVPMGLAFKMQTGIDPLTVNQTNFTEGSTTDFGRVYHKELMQKIRIDEPVVLLKGRKPYTLIEQEGYDIYVVHPATSYKNNRPSWLSLNGERKEVSVSPQERNLFLVQAYYEDEFNRAPLEQLVPADQTYIASDYGYYSLYLKPGRYKLVFRGIDYQQLNVREKQVQ
ncbi:hypothetical protein LZZ85_04915 [Terrimonas sp. NA20]|uniref:Erythromycin esterase n=1 Tax=Terrimonas ginsenosidimutans TaxID=2908004 RepID=A0ABS9KMR3_9BACT|nr:hypothetical protein [Terrimonas ginsenosidimutans]MCG2613607.1 hypothetical protein [Terrimonas ginsenosidimutans]